MTDDIIRRIRRARLGTVEIEGKKYTYRRPTDAEATRFGRNDIQPIDVVREFTVGWEGITEADLVTSGSSDAVPFSSDVWREYVDDRPALWAPLFEAIVGAYAKHQEAVEKAGKA